MSEPVDLILSLPLLALFGGAIGHWLARRHARGGDLWTWRGH